MAQLAQPCLIVLAGPSLAGKKDLARAIATRRHARYLAVSANGDGGDGALPVDEIRRAHEAGEDVVLDGSFATCAEREKALAVVPPKRAVLVSWMCSESEAERIARRRFAARPRYIEEHELDLWRADMARREPIGDEVSLERLAMVSGGVPLSDQLLAVEALLEPLPAARRDTPMPSPRRLRRVLAVEDDADTREALVGVLHELGYEVGEAATGEEALDRMASEEPYDLLIADQRMPGMSGTDLIAEAHDRFPSVRTLLLTGYGDDRTCAAALEAEADTVLAKPLRVMDLRRALDDALM